MSQKTDSTVLVVLPELRALGLTDAESKCYQLLVAEGTTDSYKLANKLNFFPNAVYRLMRRLIHKGFVVKLETKPASYQPVPPMVAIEAFAKQKTRDIEEQKIRVLELLTTNKPISKTHTDLLTGRNALFTAYLRLAQTAKKEILIISIGEPVTDEVKLANRDALERGVAIKMIAHKHDKDNEELLQNWVKMGIEVRHTPDWGFHLVVVDGAITILSINNPEETKERTSLVLRNNSLTKAFRSYFMEVWNTSKKISMY